ncbi:hypothetical protein B0H14DRAFT_3720972 [Mycena olivaceomarginata]|nr:hypothetical protein B0H14DRAFT_3720972 [Mycena olivaceomarginata]
MGGPLNVSIVGSGIASLAAAIALRRNGHHVQIFESAEIKTEIGAAIVVPVNALLVLDHFGYKRENLRSVDFVGAKTFNALGGERNPTTVWKEMEGKVGVTRARTDLHRELERLAVGPGEGPPAVVRLGSKVVNCNPEEGSLTLSDGSMVQSDLVLGADGISSIIRTHILGYEQKSVSTGLTTSRVLLDMSSLDSRRRKRAAECGWERGPIPLPVPLSLPQRNGNQLHRSSRGSPPRRSRLDSEWHPGNITRGVFELSSQVLSTLCVAPRAFVALATAFPTGASHLALGQGAAQAIEDAGALGVLHSAETPRTEIPARLAAYEGLRKDRTELIGRESHDQMMVPRERRKYARDESDI